MTCFSVFYMSKYMTEGGNLLLLICENVSRFLLWCSRKSSKHIIDFRKAKFLILSFAIAILSGFLGGWNSILCTTIAILLIRIYRLLLFNEWSWYYLVPKSWRTSNGIRRCSIFSGFWHYSLFFIRSYSKKKMDHNIDC